MRMINTREAARQIQSELCSLRIHIFRLCSICSCYCYVCVLAMVQGTSTAAGRGWLPAPPLHNSSCSHPRFAATAGSWGLSGVHAMDALQATFVLALSAGILGANLLLVLGLNARRYSRFIHAQPRYLLTSLAVNDLAIGLLVTPFAFLPSLLRCWPYGETFCQIQALLRGALSQQSAVILICMAIDRYMCMLHPVRYHRHSSKKGCVAVISLTWVTSVTLYAAMVLPRRYSGFHFNATGLHACEPWYPRASLRILASCLLYFPTTMVLMYCYGSAFHVNKLRLKHRAVVCSAAAAVSLPETLAGAAVQKLVAHERRLSAAASRTMAAISLGFIVMVTPWTIQEVVAACTGSKVPPFMDFVVTWLALSNSFWNPFLYWLLNDNFRRVCRELEHQAVKLSVVNGVVLYVVTDYILPLRQRRQERNTGARYWNVPYRVAVCLHCNVFMDVLEIHLGCFLHMPKHGQINSFSKTIK